MAGRLVFYGGCSLDGYLAAADGGIAFLEDMPGVLPDTGYDDFYATIGGLIMGGMTYRQVATELPPGVWPYAGKPSYVYTRQAAEAIPDVTFTQAPPKELLAQMQRDIEGDIWLVGGGETVHLFLQEDLIDLYRITFVPSLLGAGIPLFPAGFAPVKLALEEARPIGHMVELTYKRREET